MRAIAVGNDEEMPARNRGNRPGDGGQQVSSLHVCLGRLAAAQERVAAERHDDQHQHLPSLSALASTKASMIEDSLGSSVSANS